MKKQIATLCTVLTLVACVDYNDNTESVKTVGIQLLKPDGFTDNSGLGGRTITLIADNGKRLTATTDANGLAKVNDLTPNIYNISASWEISGSEYVRLTDGQMPVLSDAHNFTLTGSLANQLLTKEETVSVQMLANENPDIIISKIYFATSHDENNKNYEAGRYIELFNQSDEPVDVSGLYIGLTESEGTQAYTLANLHEQHNDSVLLLKQIFRIPADEPHLVEPSGTVLIVNSAIDHTKNKAPLEADLTGADFEAKDNSTTRPLTNNPDVKALELIYSTYATISNMNLVNNGLCGVVIFRTEQDINSWPLTYKYPNNATKGSQWRLLPKRFVLDGVECLPNKNETGPDINAKRIYPEIDAGFTFINAVSGRSGEVVYRKTSGSTGKNGRKMLVDTNNSRNDFKVSTTIKPREYDETAEQ